MDFGLVPKRKVLRSKGYTNFMSTCFEQVLLKEYRYKSSVELHVWSVGLVRLMYTVHLLLLTPNA